MKLADLTTHLNNLLQVSTVPDYPPALNGLQLQNTRGEITKIAAAVDAHLPVVKAAIARGCDLLLVHHGLFWSGLQPITGAMFEKIKLATENNLAIYSAHLPLDGHLDLGNSILLGRAIEPDAAWEPFFPYKGFNIGVRATVEIPRIELVQRFEQAIEGKSHICAAGPDIVRNIGIVTGGAGSEVAAMKALGIDTFLTGEGPHWSYTLAEELGVNLLYGGHYATETFGVVALAEHLNNTFGLPWEFIDHPTGM
ncbi:dinuclear metal center YbgI/SA1388 family protein [Roseimicrobium gellanilyticum]|uniref:GTP cyclohydrolase 1 type 2 homolog n=1 Tax=Roseimicrobium gellanilyticum TaxID=748857 RepID=A0A366H8X3_9BACT|nr:Nif3-like dinuclear metal center hexameric protein [Roseimicrobium gellanilyticum]RBP38564.1 dinuclear metal center YbgI/SA1388 family protein [Roseimicrobium gellanilyticum]